MPLCELIKPVLAPGKLEQVTDAQLAQFSRLIYGRTGIRISPQKKTLLSNRLRRRLRKTGIDGFGDYYHHLRRLRADDPEWDAFLQEITTHETYLFRDESQWDWFRNSFLSDVAAEARSGKRQRSLRIWSAACSTGDELVTVACCIADALPGLSHWQIHLLGTDIGIGALERARSAVFGQRAMRLVPQSYRHRFFIKATDAHVWQARPVITEMLTFRQHNLMDPLRGNPFDLVLLKNVLIYFDATSKTRVIENVRSAILPGGLLVSGAAEGVADLVKDFRRIQPWLYRKPATCDQSPRS